MITTTTVEAYRCDVCQAEKGEWITVASDDRGAVLSVHRGERESVSIGNAFCSIDCLVKGIEIGRDKAGDA